MVLQTSKKIFSVSSKKHKKPDEYVPKINALHLVRIQFYTFITFPAKSQNIYFGRTWFTDVLLWQIKPRLDPDIHFEGRKIFIIVDLFFSIFFLLIREAWRKLHFQAENNFFVGFVENRMKKWSEVRIQINNINILDKLLTTLNVFSGMFSFWYGSMVFSFPVALCTQKFG